MIGMAEKFKYSKKEEIRALRYDVVYLNGPIHMLGQGPFHDQEVLGGK